MSVEMYQLQHLHQTRTDPVMFQPRGVVGGWGGGGAREGGWPPFFDKKYMTDPIFF